MLADGYTLAAVERVLARAPAGVAPQGLAMHKALLTPWLPEEPELVDRAALAARAGVDLTTRFRPAGKLGVVTRLTADLQVESPTLLRVGLQVVALGIPPEIVIAAQQQVTAHAQAAAKVYVDMFRDTVWRAFADAGQPDAGVGPGPAGGRAGPAGRVPGDARRLPPGHGRGHRRRLRRRALLSSAKPLAEEGDVRRLPLDPAGRLADHRRPRRRHHRHQRVRVDLPSAEVGVPVSPGVERVA